MWNPDGLGWGRGFSVEDTFTLMEEDGSYYWSNGDETLDQLEKDGISGIDLCGNGVVISKGTFFVFRSGGKNRFTSSAPIKNIYRKNSSMVGRVFLVRATYETVQDVLGEINRRNPLVGEWGKKPEEDFFPLCYRKKITGKKSTFSNGQVYNNFRLSVEGGNHLKIFDWRARPG